MCEADFAGIDAGTYYADRDFYARERDAKEKSDNMKNRLTVRHGMLTDLKQYLTQSGWAVEEPVGEYEVLRARKPGYPRPLLVHDRDGRGCGYSIDERDMKVYRGWQRNRRRRGLDPFYPSSEEEKRELKLFWRGVKP